eukprot:754210-Hanusia_phi.AAC.2
MNSEGDAQEPPPSSAQKRLKFELVDTTERKREEKKEYIVTCRNAQLAQRFSFPPPRPLFASLCSWQPSRPVLTSRFLSSSLHLVLPTFSSLPPSSLSSPSSPSSAPSSCRSAQASCRPEAFVFTRITERVLKA